MYALEIMHDLLELIRKKFREGLTAEEQTRLEAIDTEMNRIEMAIVEAEIAL